MIKGVILRRGKSTSNKQQVYYTHQSHLRNIQGIVSRSVVEGIREALEKFTKAIKPYLPKSYTRNQDSENRSKLKN